jgi:hypothetical protein
MQNKEMQNYYYMDSNLLCPKSTTVLIKSSYKVAKFTQNYPVIYKTQLQGVNGLVRAVSALKNSYLISLNSEQYYFNNLLKLFIFQNIAFCNSAKTFLI